MLKNALFWEKKTENHRNGETFLWVSRRMIFRSPCEHNYTDLQSFN